MTSKYRVRKYHVRGFFPVGQILAGDIFSYPVYTAITVYKGDAIHATGGYATNSVADITTAFLGVAASACINTTAAGFGTSGDLWLSVIKPRLTLQFIVPVEGVLISQAAIGNTYDLGTYAYSILISDTIITSGPGFKVDDIDVSAAAIDGSTYGYAIGHFEFVS